jgi:hypothetical protein
MQPARPAYGFRTGDGHGVQGIGNRLQVPARKVQVDHRVFEFDVTQQELNGAQVGSRFQQMSGVGMPPMSPET